MSPYSSRVQPASEDNYSYIHIWINRGVKLLILLTFYQFVVQISTCGLKPLLPVVCDVYLVDQEHCWTAAFVGTLL